MKQAASGSIIGRQVEISLFDADYYDARDPDSQPANLPTVFGTVVRTILDDRDPAWRCYVVQLTESLSFDREGIEPEWRHITTSYVRLSTWAASSYEGRDIIAEELLQGRPFRVLVAPILTELEQLPDRSTIDNVDIWPSICDGLVRLIYGRKAHVVL